MRVTRRQPTTRRARGARAAATAASLALLPAALRADFTVDSMDPAKGPPGTVLVFGGTFDPAADYTVNIGGTPAAVTGVTAEELRASVAPDGVSGAVEIAEVGAGGGVFLRFPFEVSREVTVNFSPPPGVGPSDYTVTTDGFESTDIETGAEVMTMNVPVDRPKVVWAVREAEDPVFLAVARPGEDTLVIDAAGTAAGLAFLSPLLQSSNPDRAAQILDAVEAHRGELASVIGTLAGDGRDYLGKRAFEDGLAGLITAVLEDLAEAPVAGAPPPVARLPEDSERVTLKKDLNPDYASSLPATRGYLEAGARDDPIDRDRLILEVAAIPVPQPVGGDANLTPLDWRVELFEILPGQFPDGLRSIEALEDDDTVAILGSLGTGFVPATLETDKLNYIGWAYNLLLERAPDIQDPDATLAGGAFRVPRDIPAIYLVEAYSGNLWYGTDYLLPDNVPAGSIRSKNQNALIERLEGGREKWAGTLRINVIQTVIDLFGAAIDLTIFKDPTCLNELVNLQIDNTGGAFISQTAAEDPARVNFFELFKAFAGTAVNVYGGKLLKEGAFRVAERFAEGLGRTLLGTLNVTKKLSFVGNTIERFTGYALPSTLAVERFIIVVGNPFAPVIRSFEPREGREGDLVRITGSNFPETREELTVEFCTFASTDGNVTARLPATVVALEGNTAVVEVPAGWKETFGERLSAAVCIFGPRGGVSSSNALPAGRRQFSYLRPPKLDPEDPEAVDPRMTGPGAIVRLKGCFFDGEARLRNEVLLDGSTPLEVVNASGEFISARLPSALADGEHTLEIKLGDQRTDPVTITVLNPVGDAAGFLPFANRVTVTRLDLSNAADGEISVFEAFAIARGDLGRPIEQHDEREFLPEGDPQKIPFTRRETDHVSGDDSDGFGGGALTVDRITLDPDIPGGPLPVMTLGAPLPALSTGDDYDLPVVFDGSGLPADTIGLVLDGTVAAKVSNFVLRGFGGGGVHLTGGARLNRLEDVRVENTGGHGFLLDGGATNNELTDNQVSGASGSGIVLTGPGVKYNTVRLTGISTNEILGLYEDCSDYGVLVEEGANFNQVTPGTTRNNGLDGVRVVGEATDFNVIGINSNVRPRFSDVYNNGGCGVYLGPGVNNTVVRWINPAGNTDDGVLLEGPDCSHNQVDGLFTGVDYFTDPANPVFLENGGSGIRLDNGAHHNLLGSLTPGGFGERGSIVGNAGSGILLEGDDTAFNRITRTNIGDTETSFSFPTLYGASGEAGIHIRDGSHDNTLGHLHGFLDLHIFAQEVGILIEGFNTRGNVVFGNQIGSDHGFFELPPEAHNRVGVQLRDGTHGNTIGLPGGRIDFMAGPDFVTYRNYNIIANSDEAGIRIGMAGADEFPPPDGGRQPNVVQGNRIGENDQGNSSEPNAVGIKFSGGQLANLIGGTLPEEGNRIFFNNDAGLHFDGANGSDGVGPILRKNRIENSGLAFAAAPGNPYAGPPRGVGILVDGDSEDLEIGDVFFPNTVHKNVVGAYIAATGKNTLRHMTISENIHSGVFLHEAEGAEIGGDGVNNNGNVIVRNGSNNPGEAGIVISGGRGNSVFDNYIGVDSEGRSNGTGNLGHGVILADTRDNRVGGDSPGDNVIGANQDGVVIRGASTTGNVVGGNLIGGPTRPNTGNGVTIEDGARRNLIGGQGDEVVAGVTFRRGRRNIIEANGGLGVEVVAPATGNSILRNRILDNAAGGIGHGGGGNDDQPPPVRGTLMNDVIRGEVPDLATVPVGSRVEVYDNPLGPGVGGGAGPLQGRRYLGRTFVETGGLWRLDASQPFSRRLTMTATHPVTGSTSTFGTDIDFDPILSVARADGEEEPGERNVPTGAAEVRVLTIEVGAVNGTAVVGSVTFEASGDLPEDTAVASARLVIDADENGVIDEEDITIGEGATFDADDGTVTFITDSIQIDKRTTQHWALVYELAGPLAEGTSFSAALVSPEAIPATFILPVDEPAVHEGTFPVRSDDLTVGGGAFDGWLEVNFSAAERADPAVSGPGADPDADGIPNLLEHAFGLDPRSAVERPAAVAFRRAAAGGVPPVLEFLRRRERGHIDYEVEVSTDLIQWISGPGAGEEASAQAEGADVERVQFNLMPDAGTGTGRFARLRVRLR